ncbi:phage tail protein [Halobacterium yunchengense]|uniref:phage tail protein n=1 Tax=Halobacterium yunchengense TaxID=3108497 RepID=UPI0030081117
MDEAISRREFIEAIEVGGVTVVVAGCQDVGLDDLNTEPTETTMRDQQQQTDTQGSTNTGRFEVRIGGQAVSGWQRVTLPSSSVAVEEYEGGDQTLWGEVAFDHLEMERNFVPGESTLRDWFADVRAGKVEEGRREIAITVQNEDGTAELQWEFSGAWIEEYAPPELDATAGDDAPTETVAVAFDEMIRTEG